jgi:hypothetical protein
MTRGYPHQHDLAGHFVSDLSTAYSFVYHPSRGLLAILYDQEGKLKFGPTEAGAALNSIEAAPYTYSIRRGKPFLACLQGYR